MAKINFNERLAEARQRPAYWIERIVLDFTVALESAMRRKNVSGKELAAKIDVSPAYISKVLSGTPNLTVKSMVRLAHALDLRVALRMEDAATFDLGVERSESCTFEAVPIGRGYTSARIVNLTRLTAHLQTYDGAVNQAEFPVGNARVPSAA